MDIADALSQLADIHMPQQPGWWPLAPGWWVLLALLLIALAVLTWRMMKRLQLQRRLNNALSELDKCHDALNNHSDPDKARLDFVNQVNAVLRRVALAHFPPRTVASLSGQGWVTFLKDHDTSNLLSRDLADALASGRFAPRCDIDTQALDAMARAWIKARYLARIESNTQSPTTANEQHA